MFEKISDELMETLYSVHNQNFTVSYDDKGIRELSMTIHPTSKTILPVENLFKQLNTNEKSRLGYRNL